MKDPHALLLRVIGGTFIVFMLVATFIAILGFYNMIVEDKVVGSSAGVIISGKYNDVCIHNTNDYNVLIKIVYISWGSESTRYVELVSGKETIKFKRGLTINHGIYIYRNNKLIGFIKPKLTKKIQSNISSDN